MKTNKELKTDLKKRYYYHLTLDIWGNNVILKPIGDLDNCNGRGLDEPLNKRTCVAPSIAHCLSAICFITPKTFFIYRTKNKVTAKIPYNVCDVGITKERWLINKTKFVKIGILDINKFYENEEDIEHENIWNYDCGSPDTLKQQRNILKAWEKALKTNKCKGLQLKEGYNYDRI